MLRRVVLSLFVVAALGQQQCYYAAGGQYRGPDNLVPCNSTGASSCCLLGDTCLSGNTCYNPNTGNLYQYGCTDITYNDETCPYKCGFDPDKSPWTALEYCNDVQDLTNTWICHGPESCGCEWSPSKNMLILQPRGCRDMGNLALVALYAPQKLAPYVSLPSKVGGSTGYYSPTLSEGSSTWIETAVPGYTPEVFTQLTTYRRGPTTSVWVDREAMPGSGTYAAAMTWTGSAPTISAEGTGAASSGGVTSTGSPSLQSEADTTDAGLSTGAKVGIGVGVAGGVLFLAGLGICLYCFGRKRRHKSQAARPDQQLRPEYQPSPPQTQVAMQMPPYPSPPQQQMHWAPVQSGPPLMDPGYGYGTASPQHSEMSRNASQQGKVSYSQVSSSLSSPPVPVLPMELAGEELRRSVHEMEAVGVSGSEEERKRQVVGMGTIERERRGMGNAF